MVSSEIEQFRFAVKVSRNSGKAAQNVGETWDLFVERILNLKKTRPDMAVGVRSHLNRFFDLHCGCPLHCQSDVRIRRSRSVWKLHINHGIGRLRIGGLVIIRARADQGLTMQVHMELRDPVAPDAPTSLAQLMWIHGMQ
jgi:hypothetical protein